MAVIRGRDAGDRSRGSTHPEETPISQDGVRPRRGAGSALNISGGVSSIGGS
jgi:hypothetical protein